MFASRFRTLSRLALALGAFGLAASCAAQNAKTANDHPDSKVDIYAGYGFFHPVDSGINGYQYNDLYNPNGTLSVTGYFNHYLGVQAEAGYFAGPCDNAPCNKFRNPGELVYTFEAGPVFRYPLGPVVPFLHAVGGGVRINGPAQQPLTWGWGVTGGVGIDYILPYFNKHIAVRPIQADFQYSQVDYGPLRLPAGIQGGSGEIDAIKLSGGVVVRFGESGDTRPVMLGCTIAPDVVHPGDVISVTGSTTGLNPRKKAAYTWSANGGRLTPMDSTASVDTAALAPGDYTVTGRVSQGNKASQNAVCSAAFTVKPYEPPSLTCSANPATASSGTAIQITTVGTSPQNRPLTYSYTTTAGQLTSSGPTARLSTAGLAAGPITVTCNAVDDFGQAASFITQIALSNPPVPVIPQSQTLCSLSFRRDRARPVRVDNESKACLDDVALTMNQQTDAKLVIVGNASPDERPEAAAERSLNVRQYLTREKGLDPARVEVRVGDTSGRTVNNFMVPSGAVFSDANTQTFDESTITRHGQAYGLSAARGTRRTSRRHPAPRRSQPPLPAYMPPALP